MTKILSIVPATRQVETGTLSDGTDRARTSAAAWVVNYMGDDGLAHVVEFDHDPTPAELDGLAPLQTAARNAVRQAVGLWDQSQAAWQAAGTVAAMLNALHQEHVAMMAALRAIALLSGLQ